MPHHPTSTLGALLFVFVLLLTPAARADEPSPVRIVNAFPKLHFTSPLFLSFVPDGSDRIVVVQQTGQVLCFDNKPDAATTQALVDLHDRLRCGGEEGLLGLVFHPDFKTNHQVFLYYTSAAMPRHNILARFNVDPQTLKIDKASQKVILSLHHKWSNHDGGMIAFGPDHMLYVGVGDGGAGGDPDHNGQNKNVLLAKILRIDPDHSDVDVPTRPYAIPKDNPFVAQPNARGEVWCYGIRNPWRFSFDRKTGDLWCGDVGQDKWEEVDLIKKGLNYGWNIYEGFHTFAHPRPRPQDTGPFEMPIVEQGHNVDSRCVIGGYVYRGKKLPALEGHYIYGDYVTNLVWDFVYHPGQKTTYRYLGSVPAVASFGEDRDGEVYAVSYQGAVYKFEMK